MSKYIIEVDDNAVGGLFKVKGFNALVFDKNGLDRLQKYEEPVEEVKEERSWPQVGDEYYSVNSSGSVATYSWDNDNLDCRSRDIGNVFRTEGEARFALERLKVLAEMKKFAEPFDAGWYGNAVHYYIFYSVRDKCLDVDNNLLMRSGKLYFTSEKRARECIEAVGEDRIKEFYIGVK
jgi:hypothetical protein